MRTSPNGVKLIQLYESLGDGNRTTPDFEPYICPANIYTVGWGHVLVTPEGKVIDVDKFGAQQAATLASAAMQRKFGKQALTRAEADHLLDTDLIVFENAVEHLIGTNNATQTQFDALVSFTFNVGGMNFNSSTLKRLHIAGKRDIGHINLQDLCTKARAKSAPTDMPTAFVSWCNANGQFALGLFRRRVAEMLVYSGWDSVKAYSTMLAFKG